MENALAMNLHDLMTFTKELGITVRPLNVILPTEAVHDQREGYRVYHTFIEYAKAQTKKDSNLILFETQWHYINFFHWIKRYYDHKVLWNLPWEDVDKSLMHIYYRGSYTTLRRTDSGAFEALKRGLRKIHDKGECSICLEEPLSQVKICITCGDVICELCRAKLKKKECPICRNHYYPHLKFIDDLSSEYNSDEDYEPSSDGDESD